MVEFRQNILTLRDALREDVPQSHSVRHLHTTPAGAPVLHGAVGYPVVNDLRHPTVEARIAASGPGQHPSKCTGGRRGVVGTKLDFIELRGIGESVRRAVP